MSYKFFHSVYLEKDLCRGCINCIKRCPTEAIRVRNGKACITSEFCIDCGECVRTCTHHAKQTRTDSLDILDQFEYTIALPAPSFYAQFNNLEDINIVLTALIYLGFNDVFEVAAGAEIVSEASRAYVSAHKENWPYISTACPTIVRLIRVRLPNLIKHLLPINPPVEVAARIAKAQASAKTGLPPEKIGAIFISPCPSKATYAKSPLGTVKSAVDGVIAAKDIYSLMLPLMKEAEANPKDLAMAGKIGVGWGYSGGEVGGLMTDSYLAADGVSNCIKVLEDLEDEKFAKLQFIELNACNGGCVGGVLNVENPYVAKAKLKNLNHYLPVSKSHCNDTPIGSDVLPWSSKVDYEPVFRLGSSMIDSINKMKQIDSLLNEFPGLDCGSCGAPTCRALAEDIVRGSAKKTDCVQILRSDIHKLTKTYTKLARYATTNSEDPNVTVRMLLNYIDRLTSEISMLDSQTHNGEHRDHKQTSPQKYKE